MLGDTSWHKDRAFISEVFRLEYLGFELVGEDFHQVFFREIEIGEFDVEPCVLDLCRCRDEWIARIVATAG